MAVTTQKRLFFGVLTAILFAACSLTGGLSGDNQTDNAVPTLIVSPTPNLTVTAVFANATANATNQEEVNETEEPAADSPTNTPEAGATNAPTATPEQVAYAETPAVTVIAPLEAYFIDDAPTIDGDLTDWNAEMYSMTAVVYGSQYYANEADLSGQFKVGWDSSYLYLGVVVFDTRFAQTATGSQLFLGDSLEILLDTNLAGDAEVTELNSDDFQIGISPGNLHDVVIPEAYMWYPSERMSSLPTVQIAGMLINGGYVVEVAMPWAEVGVSPTDGLILGFLLSISDNDMLNMNTQQSVVSFSALRELQNPTSWSELKLVNP